MKQKWTSFKRRAAQTAKKYFNTPVRLALLFILMSHPLFYGIAALARSFSPEPLTVLPGVIYYFPQTGMKLVAYILAVPVFFLYYGAFFYLINHPAKKIMRVYIRLLRSWKKMLVWFAGAFLAAVLAKHTQDGAVKLLLTAFVFVLPLATKKQLAFIWNKIIPAGLVLSVAASLAWLGYMVLPFIFTPLQVENDYLNIPTGLSAQAVQNVAGSPQTDLEFMQQYNPLIAPAKRTLWCMTLSNPAPVARMAETARWNDGHSYFLQDDKLCFQWIVDEEVKSRLSDQMTPQEALQLDRLLGQVWNQYDRLIHPSKTEIKQYPVFELIRSQMHWQALARGFIHHHNHLFGAAHAYLKGQPLQKIFMQYGLLNTVAIAWVLTHTVGFNYSNYVHFYYLFYPLYYVFLFWFGWIILKDRRYSALQILLSVGALSFSSYMFLKLAPGINPARHFFDIFTVVTFYLYLAKKQKAWLLLSVAAVWAGILNNMHFGAFIFVSLAGVLFVKNAADWKNRSRFELFSLALLVVGAGGVFLAANVGSKELEGYFLNGLLGFEIRNTLLYVILTLTGLIYLLLAYNWRKKDPLNYTLLLLVFYSQGVMLYFLRSAVIIHFYTMLSTFALTGTLALKLFFGIIFKGRPKAEKAAVRTVLLAACVFFFASVHPFKASKKDILKKFKNRQTYFWTLPNTQFETTMPEKPFADGAALINKYNPGPGVYMISQYDNIFPLISDKYNNMPMIDMQWYLITPKEFNLAVNAIKQDKPQYIFVDSDISRNYYLDIIRKETPAFGYLYEESRWRAQRLTQMQRVFNQIKDDYKPVESTELITAYKRVNDEK